MQSAFYLSPETFLPPLQWKQTPRNLSVIQKPKLGNIPKGFVPSMSLRTSYGYEFEGTNRGEGSSAFHLPVVIRDSGTISRYFWDGTDLQLVCLDGNASKNWFASDDWFLKFCEFCVTALSNFLIPRQVSRNYMGYVKWKFLHRVFSSALQVLATQAMFRAMGFGYSCSLPSAAAVNWVLKDGLGRLSRCIYTASLASAFDTNLKMSAVHRSFAIADNLGEVSAKAQIQTVCFDNLGLMLAALLNILCKSSQRLQAGLPFIVYPIFTAIDLFGIYQGLKHIHLQTLTKDRIEAITDTWIQLGFVPSPAEVSREEGIDFQWKKGRKRWPIRIGCADPRDPNSKLPMRTMCSLSNKDFCFICMESSKRHLRRNGQLGILLCLREGAGTTDIIMGLLQACHIRKELMSRSKWEHVQDGTHLSEPFLKEWFKVVEDSKRCAQEEINALKEEICRTGWAVKSVLLSTREQARYSLLDV